MTMPKSSETKGFLSFLQADDLKKGEQKIVVLGVRNADEGMQSDFMLHVKVGKREYQLGLKLNTTSYDICHKKFGEDETRWSGEITVKPRYTKKYPDGFVEILE